MTQTKAEKLRQRNRELSILNSIAQALNSSVDLAQALQGVLEQVASLLDLQTGWIWLLDEETGASYLAAAQNLPPALAENPHRMEGSCYCLRTYREDDMAGAANINVVECSRLQKVVDGTDGLRYHASIPLNAHGKKLGVLNVASTDWRPLSAGDLRLLHTVGDMLGIAIERARLFAQSARLGAVEERNRLAREIHDTLAQGLTAVSLQLESADALLETNATLNQLQPIIRRALALTQENLEEVRRSVMDLRAAPLAGRSLAEALEMLVGGMEMAVVLRLTGANRPLAPRVEAGLYRLAQEALNNIDKHAAATQATLDLVITPAEVWLTVEDNGRGFDVDTTPADRFGLVGMNERVRLLGGTLRLESCPGEGTRVAVRLPL